MTRFRYDSDREYEQFALRSEPGVPRYDEGSGAVQWLVTGLLALICLFGIWKFWP